MGVAKFLGAKTAKPVESESPETSTSKSDVAVISEDLPSSIDEEKPAVLENTSWKRHIWDTWGHPDKKHVKIIFKLDVTLLALASMSTFIKYLDKINLSYAYVNGMKEELGIEGNELNYANTGYNIASIICGFPWAFLMVKMNTKWFVVLVELFWILVTFCFSAVKTPTQMVVLRTIVGAFESAHYPALSYILGTYYTSGELARRNVILQSSTSIGSFFAGYVASGTYTGLNGVAGRSGWRWVFIIDGIISLGIIGPQIFFFSDRLSNRKPDLVLNETDIAYLKERRPDQKVDKYDFKLKDLWDAALSLEVWAFWGFGVFQDLASLCSSAYLLWLKAWNKREPGSYTVPQIDHYGSILYAVQTVIALSSGWISDTVCRGKRWPPIVVSGVISFVVCILLGALPVYPNNRAFRFFLYLNTTWSLATAGLYWAWCQEYFKDNLKQKAIATGGINIGSFVANSIVNNIWYKTSEMPSITAGYYISGVNGALYSIDALLLGLWERRKRRRTIGF
ncbi:unnamed protein product [Kuraishia capsulata CBS 1993]|uniref:Major facilitator superfamily (MFS) profile domain-containing protein n=1 Tax=Kuraishia capsulata CBS 1993 TaxID=1382522 RepID=W6MMC9_9ASCO|nr:uncharacterized protein KUCA_T00002028001 [Kuraishia capsulata CBS 1993]CDK26057.1 unnamed protein product [Kuraishia capsulata CBS 1993]